MVSIRLTISCSLWLDGSLMVNLEKLIHPYTLTLNMRNIAWFLLLWSLSILTCPPCIYIMLNVVEWSSLPISEARGALYTVPGWLDNTLYLHPTRPPPKRLQFFYHIIIFSSSAPTLLSLSLRIRPPPPPRLPTPPWPTLYPGWSAPTISWIGVFPASDPPPNTIPS